MIGGISSLVMSAALSAPPAAPVASARGGGGDGQAAIAPGGAENDGGETHHGADREIDAAGDHHGRCGEREQAEFDRKPDDLEEISRGEEAGGKDGEYRGFQGQGGGEHPFPVRK